MAAVVALEAAVVMVASAAPVTATAVTVVTVVVEAGTERMRIPRHPRCLHSLSPDAYIVGGTEQNLCRGHNRRSQVNNKARILPTSRDRMVAAFPVWRP
eukprot:CAMPEP_0195592536 /NCGR_PEP_ID=MMETSP0815-20121206/403_1 /TAXON_ID=97485 /ORGANISM="Prymnesium parvum, Strain Texoma1" /LENGTH=98 /DNA_ID=CAMNT_0040731615 /DNA_START=715 /DNA_END=1011 /DNA_ORIENTATION=-